MLKVNSPMRRVLSDTMENTLGHCSWLMLNFRNRSASGQKDTSVVPLSKQESRLSAPGQDRSFRFAPMSVT